MAHAIRVNPASVPAEIFPRDLCGSEPLPLPTVRLGALKLPLTAGGAIKIDHIPAAPFGSAPDRWSGTTWAAFLPATEFHFRASTLEASRKSSRSEVAKRTARPTR
jgi:hypothetical protein